MLKNVSIPVKLSSVKGVLPFAVNAVCGILGTKGKLAPFYISWLLTYRCNRKCQHCDWVWNRTDSEHLKLEMSDTQRLSVADQIASSWTWGVSISGGEPLLDPLFLTIVEKLKRRQKVVNICTNGVLLEKYASDLVNLPVDTITVSFDSHIPEFHDKIRGVKGTFEQAIKGLSLIRDLRGKKRFPKLVIKGVIFPSNLSHLDNYVSFFKKYADIISFQPVQNNFGHQVHDTTCLFTRENEKSFVTTMQNLMKKWPEFNHPYYIDMAEYLFHPDRLITKKRFRCIFSSSMYLGIDPYGNTGGCLERFTSGSLKEKTLREIWNGEKCAEDHRKMLAFPRSCICWNYGHFLDSYLLPVYNFFHPER
jgi:MoaA/NifB/PqqE/SkfB family radical SAM enzyme